jgi:hypothetical protein
VLSRVVYNIFRRRLLRWRFKQVIEALQAIRTNSSPPAYNAAGAAGGAGAGTAKTAAGGTKILDMDASTAALLGITAYGGGKV